MMRPGAPSETNSEHMAEDSTPFVIHDESRRTFCVLHEGQVISRLVYSLENSFVDLLHTETRPAFQGRGLAARLSCIAFEYARGCGIPVKPSCTYIRDRFLDRHPSLRSECVEEGATSVCEPTDTSDEGAKLGHEPAHAPTAHEDSDEDEEQLAQKQLAHSFMLALQQYRDDLANKPAATRTHLRLARLCANRLQEAPSSVDTADIAREALASVEAVLKQEPTEQAPTEQAIQLKSFLSRYLPTPAQTDE